MNLLLLVHYPPMAGPSMVGFADLIRRGLQRRGHRVSTLTAPPLLSRLALPGSAWAKWLGYVDQFLLFPPLLWWRLRRLPADTLVVVADQALGPWVPLLRHRPHLIHCHDLLALESSLGQWPVNPVGLSGRLYQRLIRWGFRRGRCFLSVSAATQEALRPHLATPLANDPSGTRLAVLANPLDPALLALAAVRQPAAAFSPYLLHVGSTWYKNRAGLLDLCEHLWRDFGWSGLQLVLVGSLDPDLRRRLDNPALSGRVTVLEGVSRERLIALYQHAEALVFPSWAEGFGWPPLEALACGCPALISPIEPLSSLTGTAATHLPPFQQPDWAVAAASVVDSVLRRTPTERHLWRARGLAQASRYVSGSWLDALEAHYHAVLTSGRLAHPAPSFPVPCLSNHSGQ